MPVVTTASSREALLSSDAGVYYPNAFDVLFDNEGRDATWAPGQETAIKQASASMPSAVGASLRVVECKTTVCRMTFSHDSEIEAMRPDKMTAFQHEITKLILALKVKHVGKGTHYNRADRTTTVWLTRDGYAPPNGDGTARPDRVP